MGSRTESAVPGVQDPAKLLHRFVVRPEGTGSPKERAARARQAMSGLRAGVRVTKAMYRPGR